MYGSTADEPSDSLPEETPPTDEEMEAMHRYFESLAENRVTPFKEAFREGLKRLRTVQANER